MDAYVLVETRVRCLNLPRWLSALFLRQTWSSWISPGWLASKPQGSPSVCLPSPWITGTKLQVWLFHGWRGLTSGALMLPQQALYQQSRLRSPVMC